MRSCRAHTHRIRRRLKRAMSRRGAPEKGAPLLFLRGGAIARRVHCRGVLAKRTCAEREEGVCLPLHADAWMPGRSKVDNVRHNGEKPQARNCKIDFTKWGAG